MSLTSPVFDRLHLGAAYYPEHWPEECWPEDIRLMREAGLSVARLAEFAWPTLEPTEGEFRFDWLDRAISTLASADIATVLGTPTAAPPAWLVQQCPDLLAEAAYGQRFVAQAPVSVAGEWFAGTSCLWAERLKVRDEANTQVIARYGVSNGWLNGQPAVTVHPYGRGRVHFVGAYFDEGAQQLLLDHIVAAAGVQPALETPSGVEARKRVNAEGVEVFTIINHERAEQFVRLPWQAREHLSGRSVKDELKLAPYGVAILTPLDVQIG